ncbi:MAG TPA: hypothetical protein VN829_10030 [Dongiaceae bacterium]|nr:hypothetical protein [Dongiaceae bacterium]
MALGSRGVALRQFSLALAAPQIRELVADLFQPAPERSPSLHPCSRLPVAERGRCGRLLKFARPFHSGLLAEGGIIPEVALTSPSTVIVVIFMYVRQARLSRLSFTQPAAISLPGHCSPPLSRVLLKIT